LYQEGRVVVEDEEGKREEAKGVPGN